MSFGFLAPAIRVILDTADKHRQMKNDIRTGIMDLHRELRMIGKNIEEHEDQEFQELAYDIEDFLPDVFVPAAYHTVLVALRLDPGTTEIGIINHFFKRVVDLQKRQQGEARGSPSSSVESSGISETVLVGTAKSELEELLSAEDGELRVVSIVGGNGLGKTALAREVAKKFNCTACVVASECIGEAAIKSKAADLLRKILEQVSEGKAATKDDCSDAIQLALKVKKFLLTRRYLVVVDDVKELQLWDELKSAFPNNKIDGSRIIVTTSIQLVATSLSHGRYRYTMPGLNNEDSENLFFKEIDGSEPNVPRNQSIANSSKTILSKCDGSPLALVCSAKHLKRNDLTVDIEMVGRALGTEVAGAQEGSELWKLKRSLDECYSSLPKYHHRRSLMSIVMSPQGHPINKNSLLRRWIAEGLVTIDGQYNEKGVASKCFNQFVNRSIIYPGITGSNSRVKRYQVQGIILEFIVHKSTCATNFATIIDPLIHPDGRLPLKKDVSNRIRRLFVVGGAESCIEEKENPLDFIRWLTICHNSASTRIPFDLSKCKLLRVLDLEGCKGIDEEVLANICKLEKSLKYLSLRGSDVRQISTNITNLVNLETLDIRQTEVNKLHMEVLLMPGLAHLFGQFELVGSHKEVIDSLKEKSVKLETLSGVIIRKGVQGFKEIMLQAEKLKKVKIWCEDKETTLVNIIPAERISGSKFLESLSIDSSNQAMDILLDGFLKCFAGSCSISSLKLQGELNALPGTFVIKLVTLGELQLSSTGLSWDALSALQYMSCLSKLKLVEDHRDIRDESFIVEEGGFISLKQLCIEAPELPKVQLKKGATPSLVSLELMLSDVTQGQNHGTAEISSQIQATAEITAAEEETPLQNGATRVETMAQSNAAVQMGASLENPHQSEAPLQTGARAEITTSESEAPHETGVALMNTAKQPAAPIQMKKNLSRWLKKTLVRLGCNLCSTVQTGATSAVSIHQPEQTTNENGDTSEIQDVHIGTASAVSIHEPENTTLENGATSAAEQTTPENGVTSEIQDGQTGAASEVTIHEPPENGAASEIRDAQTEAASAVTVHEPEQTTGDKVAASEIQNVQTENTTGDISHQQEQSDVQNGATSEVTGHQQVEPRDLIEDTTEDTSHQQEQGAIQNGATSEVTANLEVEPRVQIGETTVDISHQPEQNAIQTGETSEAAAHHRPEVPTPDVAEIELRIGVEGLLHLLKLNEVILHHSTSNMSDWETIASKHINRPYIKKSSPGQKANTTVPPDAS